MINAVGYYCGRFGPGFLGEPLNSFSNLAFVLGAAIAWKAWRARPERDPWQLLLFALAALVGVGSFVFHSHPTPATLLVDLVPIQVFGLAALGYACLRYLGLRPAPTLALLAGFFLLRQGWIAIAPGGLLGGAVTHVPALLALLAAGMVLVRRRLPVGAYLLAACAAYAAAIYVRAWDVPLCRSFPWGLHWAWHLLSALTASLIVVGMARCPPGRARQGDAARPAPAPAST